MSIHVTIVPLGDPDPAVLHTLAGDLGRAGFPADVTVAEPLPDAGYVPDRDQYLADELLAPLRRHSGERVLGVTDVDLFLDGLNYVLGLAEGRGRTGLISLARLHIGADSRKQRARALKEAVHEIGHTLGLGHCDDPRCVMYFSNRLVETDRKTSRYCARCLGRLDDAGWAFEGD